MIRSDLKERVDKAIEALKSRGALSETAGSAEIAEPRDASHGDFATSYALENTKAAGIPPRQIAELLQQELQSDNAFAAIDIAGPGFLNFRLADAYLTEWAAKAATAKGIRNVDLGGGKKVLIEFVSVNPNGPIHLGHGRGAAFGDSLARCLTAAGFEVSREFYVNDGVNSLQMQLFGESVKALYRNSLGMAFEFPEEGYKGESVEEVAQMIRDKFGDNHADDGLEFWQPAAEELMIERQREDLARFGVVFDKWFSEQSLHNDGKVDSAIAVLRKQGTIYEQDDALFLKSTAYGDDRDRCVVRNNGKPTYIASDIAYHKNKFDRGYENLIDIFGPDHHGYVERTYAGVQALGYGRDRLKIIITQMVRFIKDGKPAPMRKRNG